MGPDSHQFCEFYVEQDGKFLPVHVGDIPTITNLPGNESGTTEWTAPFKPIEWKIIATVPEQWRCSSRKRFIKLLMSFGKSRNEAALIAQIAKYQWPGMDSYQKLFYAMVLYLIETGGQ